MRKKCSLGVVAMVLMLGLFARIGKTGFVRLLQPARLPHALRALGSMQK